MAADLEDLFNSGKHGSPCIYDDVAPKYNRERSKVVIHLLAIQTI